MKVVLACVGKARGPVGTAIAEFEGRVQRYFRFERIEVKEGALRGGTAEQVMEDEGERLLARLPTQRFWLLPPPGPSTPPQSYNLRVRLYGACSSGPTGVGFDGEVEDYEIEFTPTAVTLQTFRAEVVVVPWLLLVLIGMSGVLVWGYGRRLQK